MQRPLLAFPVVLLLIASSFAQVTAAANNRPQAASVYPQQEGFVDANGLMLYYMVVGRGEPLLILHGGPGASHDYFLPYLLPLARHRRMVFSTSAGLGAPRNYRMHPDIRSRTWWRTSRRSARL